MSDRFLCHAQFTWRRYTVPGFVVDYDGDLYLLIDNEVYVMERVTDDSGLTSYFDPRRYSLQSYADSVRAAIDHFWPPNTARSEVIT